MEIETKRDYLFHHNVTGRLQKNLRLNYEQLSWEVIKQVRGKMSQRKLSEKLNFSFNQVGKWSDSYQMERIYGIVPGFGNPPRNFFLLFLWASRSYFR